MKKLPVLIAVFSLLCFSLSWPQASLKKPVSEKLHGFSMDHNRLVFSVFNKGYTTKNSFKLKVTDKKDYYEIELLRVMSDEGKALLDPEDIIYTKEELSKKINFGKPVVVKNPFYFFAY